MVKDIEDFTVSFALRLRREETLDLWNMTGKVNYWREIFAWGLFFDWHNEEKIPIIMVYRPNNTIGLFALN